MTHQGQRPGLVPINSVTGEPPARPGLTSPPASSPIDFRIDWSAPAYVGVKSLPATMMRIPNAVTATNSVEVVSQPAAVSASTNWRPKRAASASPLTHPTRTGPFSFDRRSALINRVIVSAEMTRGRNRSCSSSRSRSAWAARSRCSAAAISSSCPFAVAAAAAASAWAVPFSAAAAFSFASAARALASDMVAADSVWNRTSLASLSTDTWLRATRAKTLKIATATARVATVLVKSADQVARFMACESMPSSGMRLPLERHHDHAARVIEQLRAGYVRRVTQDKAAATADPKWPDTTPRIGGNPLKEPTGARTG